MSGEPLFSNAVLKICRLPKDKNCLNFHKFWIRFFFFFNDFIMFSSRNNGLNEYDHCTCWLILRKKTPPHSKKPRRISHLIIFSFEEQQTKVTCTNIWQWYQVRSLGALKSQWILEDWQAANVTFWTHKPNAGYVRPATERRLDSSNYLTQFTYTLFDYTVKESMSEMHLVCCRCFIAKPQPSSNDRYDAIWDAEATYEY